MKIVLRAGAVLVCQAICLLLVESSAAAAPQQPWVATWAASPQASAPDPQEPLLHIEDQTVRERVRVSLGGAQIRLRLSNECGTTPLAIGAVTVAVPSDAASIKPASLQSVTFGGSKSTTIPTGAPALSDPTAFPVVYGQEISISIYFPKRVATPTAHWLALKHAVVSKRGDLTREAKIEDGAVTDSAVLVTAVLVPAPAQKRVIVAFGDSLTDGDRSTIDADRNWPSDLVRRLSKTSRPSKVAVVNEGIAGNRLLSDCFLVKVGCFGLSALARFDRDALGVPGVTHIVLLQGVNDIGFPGATIAGQLLAAPDDAPSIASLTAAYRQLIARAHAQGVKVLGATLTPFEEVIVPGYWSEAKEATRQAINQWIRASGAFDGVVDFDAIIRDPQHPSRLLAKFASQDHLHPNDDGYQAMANSIDLRHFQ